MARLTLARKMAAITLIVWKKGVRFEAQHLKPQTARVSRADPCHPGISSGGGRSGSGDIRVRGRVPADKLGAACLGHAASLTRP
jgi:hypothetical protein